RILAVADEAARILDAVRMIDTGDRAIVLEILRVAVAETARIEAHGGEMGEEEIGAVADADIELGAEVGVAVHIAIPGRRAAPQLSIANVPLGRAGEARVVELGRYGVRRRSDREQVHDHRLVPADQRMVDVESMIRRPVPVEHIAVALLAIPTPLDVSPQARDGVAALALDRIGAIEVLTCSKEPLTDEGGCHEIAAIVVPAEVRHRLAGIAVQKMRPHTGISIRALEETRDLEHALRDLFA